LSAFSDGCVHESNKQVLVFKYYTTDTIITAATLIGALGVIGGTIVAIYKFYQKPAKLEKKLENLQKTHDEDIRKINEEQCLATYGLLACLKGLKEQGCNGPVTEAINKIEKHLNKQEGEKPPHSAYHLSRKLM